MKTRVLIFGKNSKKWKKVFTIHLTKKILVLSSTTLILFGCSSAGNSVEDPQKNPTEKVEKNIVQKNESVNLPVEIFTTDNLKIEGNIHNYKRTITSVKVEDFNDQNTLDYLDVFKSLVNNQKLNLQDDFKLLTVTLKQQVMEKARSKPYEPLKLNIGSTLVVGENDMALQNDVLSQQINYYTSKFFAGTNDVQGNVLIAIPKEIANNQNLQLKVVQEFKNKDNVKKEIVFIDLY